MPANVTSSPKNREVWRTLRRSFVVGMCLSLLLTYLLYFASPGTAFIEVVETLAIPSALSMQHFGIKSHSAAFETIVNSIFYTLLIFSLSLLYQKFKSQRLRK
jgi:hypothetical protein